MRKMRPRDQGWELCSTVSSRRKWPDERVTARYLIDLGAENPAAAFPIDRRECNRRAEFPGHPVESLAVSRRRSNGNRHAVIWESRSFCVQTLCQVYLKMRIHYSVCLMLDSTLLIQIVSFRWKHSVNLYN